MTENVRAAPYLYELRECTHSALALLERVEAGARAWLAGEEALDRADTAERAGHVVLAPTAYDAHHIQGVAYQTEVFDTLEALLALWARTSLLVYPLPARGKADDLGAFRAARGARLQALLGLAPESRLADREFRDAWMHFDERLDRAVRDRGTCNRQQFARTAEAVTATASALRVIDLEALRIYYRTRAGVVQSVALADLRAALEDLSSAIPGAVAREREARRSG